MIDEVVVERIFALNEPDRKLARLARLDADGSHPSEEISESLNAKTDERGRRLQIVELRRFGEHSLAELLRAS